MATFTVTTAADVINSGDGVLSLREAVSQANATVAGDTIVFATSLEGRTLVLTGGAMVLNEDVSIIGDSNDNGIGVTIDGNRQALGGSYYSGSHIFSLATKSGNDPVVALSGLTLTNGYNRYGATAVLIDGGTLTLSQCIVSNCTTGYREYGAAIYATSDSHLDISDSLLARNYSFANGSAIGTSSSVSMDLSIFRSDLIHNVGYADGAVSVSGNVIIEGSSLTENSAAYGSGGALSIGGNLTITRSTIANNSAYNFGGGLSFSGDRLVINDSTLVSNLAGDNYGGGGGAISAYNSDVIIRNSTITDNQARAGDFYGAKGGGILMRGDTSSLDIANSIVAGNSLRPGGDGPLVGRDLFGSIQISNGHNIFGSDVNGNASGDRENIAASAIFATINPATGGGQVNAAGIVLLKNAVTNPALSGADPLAASDTGQLGGTGRPLPVGSLPDIGSIEVNQALSTKASANNDVLTGTAKANTIGGLAGADYLKGLAGNDTLNGGDGGDLLDGGAGNDKLNGDAGIDLVFYGGSTKVAVDLSLKTDTAKRGSETDTLTNVEGAIGSSAADSFKGNEYNNLFQGRLGKDTASGGSGRDLYDFNAVADSKAGATTRDVITDFAHLIDKLDLMGIDADTGLAGNQAFRWVGTSALTGAGEVGFFTSGGNTIIRASNDADAASELEIQLTGIKTLTATDFYL